MSAQSPSAIELEFARQYDQEHARVCLQPQALGMGERLAFWRDEQLVRRALKVAGEPGLILDVACGVGRFWSVLGERANRMILGDSLLVMTSLAEMEGLKGKVQTISLDPPYGIQFGSNWQVSTRSRDVKDGTKDDTTRQPEQICAFRDTWSMGVSSFLAYLRDRLVVARELLTETGSVFVQIGDENIHLVRSLMDEVFGSENFVSFW